MAKKNEQNTTTLRNNGYLTVDEFVEVLTPGLKEYLNRNGAIGDLSHPEDLAMNSVSYLESMCHIFADFGVNYNTVKKNISK